MRLTCLWRNVDSTLKNSGPFAVSIVRWHPNKEVPYSACEAHFVAWNDLWISEHPFGSQAEAIVAMELFQQGRR
jgi:hypothetical protein